MPYTLDRHERIKGKKEAGCLFNEGQSFFSYPFRVYYLFEREPEFKHARLLIAISKNKFKRAVDRNLIKRRVREAYRKNKNHLNDHLLQNREGLLLGLIYVGTTIPTCDETERKLILILQRLIEQDEKPSR